MEKTIKLTEKAGIVLEFLQGQEAPLTGAQIADATSLNPKGIHGVLNSLVKHQLVIKDEPVTMEVVNKDGNKEERTYVTYCVTSMGADFVAEAE